MQCHKATGKGSGASFRPDGSDWLRKQRAAKHTCQSNMPKGAIVVNGKKIQ
jgi:hypothetical protein